MGAGESHYFLLPVTFTAHYYMAGSARAAKMMEILHQDWLPKQSRWSYLARLGLPITCAPLFTVNPIKNLY